MLLFQVFPIASGGCYAASKTSINRPLHESSDAKQPVPHYQRVAQKQFRDTDAKEDDDHVIFEEVLEAYTSSLNV